MVKDIIPVTAFRYVDDVYDMIIAFCQERLIIDDYAPPPLTANPFLARPVADGVPAIFARYELPSFSI